MCIVLEVIEALGGMGTSHLNKTSETDGGWWVSGVFSVGRGF